MSKYLSIGIRYMLVSVTAFGIMNVIAKYLSMFSYSEIVFFRSSSAFVVCAVMIWNKGISPWGNQKGWLLIRALVGTTAMTLFFAALQILPLASTVTVRYLAPIFAALFAMLFIGERVKPIQWLFFAMAFCGILLMKGFDIRFTNLGFALIMGSAVTSGMVYVIIRRIGKGDDPLVVVGYFMFIASVVGLILTGSEWSEVSLIHLLMASSLGIFGFFGQYFMTKALQEEKANRVAPMKYFEALFAFIVGWIWLGETYTWVPIMGMLLVVAGMVLNVFWTREK